MRNCWRLRRREYGNSPRAACCVATPRRFRLDYLFADWRADFERRLKRARSETPLANAQVAELIAERDDAIRVEPFGQRPAIECARLIDGAKKAGKRAKPRETWGKVKFDRQILATAKAVGATTLYTDDGDLAEFAERNGVRAVRVHELELPPVDP